MDPQECKVHRVLKDSKVPWENLETLDQQDLMDPQVQEVFQDFQEKMESLEEMENQVQQVLVVPPENEDFQECQVFLDPRDIVASQV